jgi:hypothetical protein
MKFKEIINPISDDLHFYGWGYIINELKHSIEFANEGPTLHTFTDCIFWPDKQRHLPHSSWIGFVHSSVLGQPGRNYKFSLDNLISHPNFINSLDQCQLLVTLTDHTANYLRSKVDLPIKSTFLPKVHFGDHFDIDKYFHKPTLRHNGFELRNVSRFFELQTAIERNIYIGHQHNYDLIINELKLNQISPQNTSVNIIFKFLNNVNYAQELSSTIGFSHYYDCAASQGLLEHIMSHTPLIINKIPPIIEYLGVDYPMYYENVSHNIDKYLLDKSFIQQTSDYLKQQSQRKEFTIEHFCEFVNQL